MAWTRSKLENHNFDHLEAGGAYTATQGEKGDEHFTLQHSLMGQLEWKGIAGDAAWEHTGREQYTAYAVNDVLQAASKTSSMAAGDLMYMKGMVVNAILDAEANQFTVNDDLSIDDKMKNLLPAVAQARQAQAQMHSEMIQYYLENFQGHLQTVAGTLQAHHVALQGISYADGASAYGSNPTPHISTGSGPGGVPQFQLGGSPIGASPKATLLDDKTGSDDNNDDNSWFLGPAGSLPSQVDKDLGGSSAPAALPPDWGKPAPPSPPPTCSTDEFFGDLKKATEHTAAEVGGLAILPAEGPLLVPGVIGLGIGADLIADDVGKVADCFEKGAG